jgi:hypothetical protein
MEDILLYLFFLLTAPIAVLIYLHSLAAERDRLEMYMHDRHALEHKIDKWRAMKRELNKWKQEERRKAEERQMLREKALSQALKQIAP